MMKTEVKTKQAVAGEFLSAKGMKRLHDCHKSADMSALGLKYPGFEGTNFVKHAVISAVSKKGDWLKTLETLFEGGYRRDWFESQPQYEAEREKDFRRAERIITYIAENGYKVVGAYSSYEKSFSKPLKYRDKIILGIRGKFSLVLEKDGKREYILLSNGEPKYSSRARKAGNKPEESIELLASWLALKEKGTVSLWHLKNKDDKGATLPNFEHRTGKNIVSVSFSEEEEDKVMESFLKQLATPECGDCKKCIHSSVCNLQGVRFSEGYAGKDKSCSGEKKFTDAQRRVIDHVNGPLCCIAVPGAGKTTSLVERLISLCKKRVRPSSILMLTFTKKAAGEIEDRVREALAKEGIRGIPCISTYNAFGFSVLKDNPLYLGRRVRLADKVDRYRLIASALSKAPKIAGMSYSGLYSEYGLVKNMESMIDEIEERGEEAYRELYEERKDVDGILAVYSIYRQEYEAAGYISYDDQIELAAQLLEEYPGLLEKYAKKYEYIMVDEFQDSSEAQVDMIYSIAHCHDNIVVVGDDDQSIYKWRGGSSKYMLEFGSEFPGAQMVYMEDNFRSRNGLLSAAQHLIDGNGRRYEKHIIGHDETPSKPVYVKCQTKDYLATIVQKALDSGIKPGDIAILARTGARLDEVQTILQDVVKCSVPKDYMVHDAVFEGIYDVLNLFYKGMGEDISLYRVFNRMGVDFCQCNFSSEKWEGSLYRRLVADKYLPEYSIDEEGIRRFDQANQTSVIRAGRRLLECFSKIMYSDNFVESLRFIVESVFGFSEHPVLDSLIDLADTKGIVGMQALYSVMSDMVLFDTDERVGYSVSLDAVNLLTCHDSKGKEFSTTIIYGVEDFNGEEEENRVLYVSMTRAMRNLYLVETIQNSNSEIYEKLRGLVNVVSQPV